jgi:recombination protein RecR
MSQRLDALVRALQILPGVGVKSASRMAYQLLSHDRQAALGLAQAIERACHDVKHCEWCYTLSETPVCVTCADSTRNSAQLCVVETPADQAAIEKTGLFKGLYFVLMGRINPLGAASRNKQALEALAHRMHLSQTQTVQEVILATNFTADGEAAAYAITEMLKPLKIEVTRLARGVPIGSELEFVDLSTIAHALTDRR